MLRFASYFVPDERCWAPTIKGGTPCVPPSEQLPLGMFSWWQHGGARVGGATDPHKPSSSLSKLVDTEKLVDTASAEMPGGLRYTPCPCALGGACRLFSAVEAAGSLYSLADAEGTSLAFAPSYVDRFGGAYVVQGQTTLHGNPSTDAKGELVFAPTSEASREPIKPFAPIARAVSLEDEPGGCALELRDVLGQELGLLGEHAACEGRAGAPCLWTHTCAPWDANDKCKQRVTGIGTDGTPEDLTAAYSEALWHLRPSFGVQQKYEYTPAQKGARSSAGAWEVHQEIQGIAQHPGGPDAEHATGGLKVLENRRLDAAIPTNDAPFLGGNFVYEGRCMEITEGEMPGEGGGYEAACKAIKTHAADMVKRRGGTDEQAAHAKLEIRLHCRRKLPLPYCVPARPDLKQIKDTARASVSHPDHYSQQCRRQAWARHPKTNEAPMGDQCPKPPVEKDVVQQDDQNRGEKAEV